VKVACEDHDVERSGEIFGINLSRCGVGSRSDVDFALGKCVQEEDTNADEALWNKFLGRRLRFSNHWGS
jgi:hypothetical protein